MRINHQVEEVNRTLKELHEEDLRPKVVKPKKEINTMKFLKSLRTLKRNSIGNSEMFSEPEEESPKSKGHRRRLNVSSDYHPIHHTRYNQYQV